MKLKHVLASAVALLCSVGAWAETDYTSLMPSTWTNSSGDFGGGRERYQGANYESGKIMYQSFTAPAAGIYEIKFYAVASSTSGRGFANIFGDNIAQAYATAGSNKATVAMTVIDQTGCTLVADANIRTLSVEAAEGETIEYGIENIATGGNWYTIKGYSAKMKTVAEIFQAQYDEAYAIWEHSTENVSGAKATFKTYVDAMNTALTGTLAEAQTASDNLAAALVTYESQSYPVKGSGVKYDFTSKMNMAINAWTCKQGNGPAQYGFTGATETYGTTVAGEVIYQTISGLANGEYEIHFYAVANAANGGGVGSTKTIVYANDQELEIDVITQNSCTPSDYERTFTVMVTDGTLKYGIKNTVAAGNWYLCKNVALYMTGAPDLSDYYNAIAAKLTTANGLKSSPMNATVLTALQDAIDATAGYADITVIGTLETLSDNLTTAINNANTSIEKYAEANTILTAASTLSSASQTIYANNETISAIQSAYTGRTLEAVTNEQKTASDAAFVAVKAWNELKAYADALVAVENNNSEANSTLASAISTKNTAATSATTTAAVTTATATLKEAMTTYAGVADPTSGNRFNLTFMLTNPDLTDFAGWTSYTDVEGWYSDQPDGNRQTMHNDEAAGSHGDAFFEYWSEAPKANGEFALYMKPTLPAGTYTINCDAFAGQPTGGDNCAVYFYANDTQGSLVNNYPMAEKEISFINESEQEVKIGLKPLTGNTYRWMGIGYVKLYKVPEAAPVVLNENSEYDYNYAGAATAKLTREIYKGFNTVMLPFSLNASEITTVFGSGTLYGFTGADAGSLNFATSTTLAANTPYLFKADAKKSLVEVEIEARTFVAAGAAQVATPGTDYNFVGTYTPYAKNGVGNPIVRGKDYVLGADDNFHLTTTQNALKAFRAYIKANEASTVKALSICIDGETTAIESLNGETMTDGAIYNMAGQRVNKAVKGLYIVNGKKILVK